MAANCEYTFWHEGSLEVEARLAEAGNASPKNVGI
jgi:hypothetical protein